MAALQRIPRRRLNGSDLHRHRDGCPHRCCCFRMRSATVVHMRFRRMLKYCIHLLFAIEADRPVEASAILSHSLASEIGSMYQTLSELLITDYLVTVIRNFIFSA